MEHVMNVVSILLVILAIFVFVTESAAATTAPQQAVAAGQGCFLGILARIAQASAQSYKSD